jgi:hypothetical protein
MAEPVTPKKQSSHDRAMSMGAELHTLGKQRQKQLKEEGVLLGAILGRQQNLVDIASAVNEEGVIRNGVNEDYLKLIQEQTKEQDGLNQAIQDAFPGMVSLSKGAAQFGNTLRALATANPLLALLAVGIALFKVFTGIQKAVTETRKDLGVSATTAGVILVKNKLIAQQAKLYGLEMADITSAQAAIRQDLGASVSDSIKLSLSFARTAAATGQTSDELATSLSIMESMSGASREVLLAMIEAAGVAPSLVMKDIAANAEFFASFAKDGGQNLIQAGIAARKLGLDMSAVASVTESLLNFESSIEASMKASMLLGREINTDKARRLALEGKTEELMKEVRRIAGGEQAFEQMNVLERRALAAAVGTSVEQLSRLVRNNTATGAPSAVAAAAGGEQSVYNAVSSAIPIYEKIEKNTRGLND